MMELQEKYDLIEKTYQESLQLVLKYHKGYLDRPTGFGKTFIMVQFITNKFFDKIVYLYPTHVIRDMVNKDYAKQIADRNIEQITYSKLSRDYKTGELEHHTSELDNYKNVLFILDEAHMAGAGSETNGVAKAIQWLQERFPNAYWFGGSATTARADKFNIVEQFFDNYQVHEYTLKDGIRDGLYAKPNYIFGSYKVEEMCEDIRKQIANLADGNEKDFILSSLSRIQMQYTNFKNMSVVLNKHIGERSYQKFFVFFPTKSILWAKEDDVVNWFQDAYPKHHIRKYTVYSELGHRNTKEVEDIKSAENTIDLIMCVDMFNMGYHVKDVTGVVMLRGTSSDTIFKQQIGRGLSIVSNEPMLIFDFVGNMLRNQYEGITDSTKPVRRGDKKMYDGFDKETVTVYDEVKDVTEVLRLMNSVLKHDVLYYIKAYVDKFAPCRWAMHGLGLRDIKSFQKVLQSFGYELKSEDISKAS